MKVGARKGEQGYCMLGRANKAWKAKNPTEIAMATTTSVTSHSQTLSNITG